MMYAFLFPLAGGVLPFGAIAFFYKRKYPGPTAGYCYHSGIATLTVGSIVRGILDIYGTTNLLTQWYWRVGGLLLFVGFYLFVSGISTDHHQVK